MAIVDLKLCAQAIRDKFCPPKACLQLDEEEELARAPINLALRIEGYEELFPLSQPLLPASISENVDFLFPKLALRTLLIQIEDVVDDVVRPAVNTTLASIPIDIFPLTIDEIMADIAEYTGESDHDGKRRVTDIASPAELDNISIRIQVVVRAFGYDSLVNFVPLKAILSREGRDYVWDAATPSPPVWHGY